MGEIFVTVSQTAPVLRAIIDDYLKRSGAHITPAHETEHVVMGVSLVASTGGVATVTCVRPELSHSVCNEPSSQRRCANCRSRLRLQKVERVSYPKALAFETRRVDRSSIK